MVLQVGGNSCRSGASLDGLEDTVVDGRTVFHQVVGNSCWFGAQCFIRWLGGHSGGWEDSVSSGGRKFLLVWSTVLH